MMSSFVRALVSAFKARRELVLKNVALRQQVTVVIHKKEDRVLGRIGPECLNLKVPLRPHKARATAA